jgi:hypothetical protein
MTRTLRAPIAVAATASAVALAVAAPAQASEENFLRTLQGKYVFLSSQQLLSAGYKVCQAEANGSSSADISNILQKDLGISVAASIDIVSAAVINLGC